MSRRTGFKALLLIILRTVFSWFVHRAERKGHLEVERKFSITQSETESLPIRLRELGFRPSGSVTMSDTFFPPRKKGEMMRVRDEVTAGSNCRSVFTLKSWVHTDEGAKERLESESVVSPLMRTIAIIIGRYATGRELLNFSKERSLYEGKLNDLDFVVAIDRVNGLGKFSGHFLEVECIVPLGEDPAKARTEIFKFVETLFGTPREDVKKSYLEMLELSKQA